jgi:hypothetical protein
MGVVRLLASGRPCFAVLWHRCGTVRLRTHVRSVEEWRGINSNLMISRSGRIRARLHFFSDNDRLAPSVGHYCWSFFAACAAVAAFLVLLHEIRIRRRDEEDLRASTARLVLVTTGDPEGQRPRRADNGDLIDGLIYSIELHINNLGRFPVIDVAFTAERIDDGQKYGDVSTDLLNPGQSLVLPQWVFHPPLRWPGTLDPPSLIRTKLTFTDDKGLRWIRIDHEQPIRLLASIPFVSGAHDRPIRKYETKSDSPEAVSQRGRSRRQRPVLLIGAEILPWKIRVKVERPQRSNAAELRSGRLCQGRSRSRRGGGRKGGTSGRSGRSVTIFPATRGPVENSVCHDHDHPCRHRCWRRVRSRPSGRVNDHQGTHGTARPLQPARRADLPARDP